MSNERTRIRFKALASAIFSITLLSGCAHTNPAALEMFVTDLLRNAAAALLL